MLETEREFTLPCGVVDDQGTLHRHGVMRMATALDEVEAMQDARVRANVAYLSILLLSRVVTRLGAMSTITPAVIERLFTRDFVYLQELFVGLNDGGESAAETQCPTCGTRFSVDLSQHGARV